MELSENCLWLLKKVAVQATLDIVNRFDKPLPTKNKLPEWVISGTLYNVWLHRPADKAKGWLKSVVDSLWKNWIAVALNFRRQRKLVVVPEISEENLTSCRAAVIESTSSTPACTWGMDMSQEIMVELLFIFLLFMIGERQRTSKHRLYTHLLRRLLSELQNITNLIQTRLP